MTKFKLITKNYLECITLEDVVDAVDMHDAILKLFFAPNVDRNDPDVIEEVNCFVKQEDNNVWIADNNEELYYELHQM